MIAQSEWGTELALGYELVWIRDCALIERLLLLSVMTGERVSSRAAN